MILTPLGRRAASRTPRSHASRLGEEEFPRTLSDNRLLSVVRSYNHTPRKCLNFKTPAEVLTRDLLHFKCESTFPPPPE